MHRVGSVSEDRTVINWMPPWRQRAITGVLSAVALLDCIKGSGCSPRHVACRMMSLASSISSLLASSSGAVSAGTAFDYVLHELLQALEQVGTLQTAMLSPTSSRKFTIPQRPVPLVAVQVSDCGDRCPPGGTYILGVGGGL